MKNIIVLVILLLSSVCFAEVNHAGELGYCVMCNEKIMERKEFRIVPNDEYNELWFEFSNNSQGRIAFCDKHFDKIKNKDKISQRLSNQIMEGIKRGWTAEFTLNVWSDKQIEKYKNDFFDLKILRRVPDEEID